MGSEKLWSAFCGVIGRPDLETHPDYATNGARIRNRVALEPLLAGEFRKRSTAGWIESLHGAGIPASPVRNFKDVVEHPQSAVREMFPTVDHPKAGTHRVTGTPVKLSETPGAPARPRRCWDSTRAASCGMCSDWMRRRSKRLRQEAQSTCGRPSLIRTEKAMPAILGFATIAILLGLILGKRMTPLAALIAVPVVTALAGGYGLKTAAFMVHGIQGVAGVAGMFIFAILYFGVMTDAGMLDPIVDKILSMAGSSPRALSWGLRCWRCWCTSTARERSHSWSRYR